MSTLLAAVEASAISTWISQSTSVLAYPTILLFHTLGLTLLVGVNVAINLRLLGFAPLIGTGDLRALFPLMWIGLLLSVGSGALLLAAKATTMAVNPAFWIKLGCVGLAVATAAAIGRQLRRDAAATAAIPYLPALAGLSMLLWLGAITAGRVMAYTGEAARFGALLIDGPR